MKGPSKLSRLLVRLYLLPFQFCSYLFLRKKILKIVTGANSIFYASMIQLINSIKIHEKGNYYIVAYDLGLTKQQRFYINRDFPEIELKTFDFSKYPPHFNLAINAGSYAWKPLIIKNEFINTNSEDYLFWIDAGCIIKRQLLFIRAALYFYGFYAVLAGPQTKELTHENTIRYLNLKEESCLRMLAATFMGFKIKNKKNRKMVFDWAEAALDEKIISPEGTSRDNHRFDQSIISLLYYKIYKTKKQPILSRKGLEILSHKNIWQ